MGTQTKCEGPGCHVQLDIQGLATVTTRNDPDTGGKYFCSEECAQAWEANKKTNDNQQKADARV